MLDRIFRQKRSAQTDCKIVGDGFVMILTIASGAIQSAGAFGRFDRRHWISAPIEPQDAAAT
jgi:hypothetical protein